MKKETPEKQRKLILIPTGKEGVDFWYAVKARAAEEQMQVSNWIIKTIRAALQQPKSDRLTDRKK